MSLVKRLEWAKLLRNTTLVVYVLAGFGGFWGECQGVI